MNVLVCGSRMFALGDGGRETVRERLDEILKEHEFRLITGGANGPDEWARQWAVDTEVDHLVLYARWEEHGKRAGILRNLRMLDEKPELVIAFWDGKSKGTAHTIEGARTRNIPVDVILASQPDAEETPE